MSASAGPSSSSAEPATYYYYYGEESEPATYYYDGEESALGDQPPCGLDEIAQQRLARRVEFDLLTVQRLDFGWGSAWAVSPAPTFTVLDVGALVDELTREAADALAGVPEPEVSRPVEIDSVRIARAPGALALADRPPPPCMGNLGALLMLSVALSLMLICIKRICCRRRVRRGRGRPGGARGRAGAPPAGAASALRQPLLSNCKVEEAATHVEPDVTEYVLLEYVPPPSEAAALGAAQRNAGAV